MRSVLLSIAMVTLVGCSEPDYAVISERDFPSPDGQHIATVVEETYFNTTGYEKQVSVRRRGQKRPRIGNVTGYGPGDSVSVAWSSSTGLTVRYTYETKRPGPAPTNIIGVTVTFVEEQRQ